MPWLTFEEIKLSALGKPCMSNEHQRHKAMEKTMRKVIALSVILTTAFALLAHSDTYFTGGDGDNLLTDSNWSGGAVPSIADPGFVGSASIGTNAASLNTGHLSGNVITFRGDSAYTTWYRQLNNDSVLTFKDTASMLAEKDGGSAGLVLGKIGSGTLNWNSTGTLHAKLMILGDTANRNGFVSQSAGTVILDGNITFRQDSVYSISGGSLSADTFNLDHSHLAGGYLNFDTTGTTGTVSLANNDLATVTTWINADKIRIDDSTTVSAADFKLTAINGGLGTEISVIPEPASLGMLIMAGSAVLFIRRKFRF